jgi:ABC-2 type transport system ATP-binding protein
MILNIEGISKAYGKIQAVDNLNLKVEKGQIYGLLGPNGSGKTTTLGIVLGILTQDSGHFTWFDNQYGEHHRQRIGAILETPNFLSYLNAKDNLKIISLIKNSDQDNFDDVLKLVNLYHRKDSKFSTYSLGMKQRLAIAGALIGNPDILIFDEPTNGLDPQGIAEVRMILKQIADQGKTVIMASHILDEVEKICSHVGIMKNGKLLASGAIGQILNNDLHCELGAADMPGLISALETIPYLSLIAKNPLFVECSVKQDINIDSLNKTLVEKGIYLNHLLVRKQRLEEEFLQITSNK